MLETCNSVPSSVNSNPSTYFKKVVWPLLPCMRISFCFPASPVSHRSTNAEMFERLFEEIEDLASNAVLHMQAKKSTHGNAVMKQEKEISNISRALPKLGNTILPWELIHTHAGHLEAHLKSIADFLLPGEGVWWKVTDGGCIEFLMALMNQISESKDLLCTISAPPTWRKSMAIWSPAGTSA